MRLLLIDIETAPHRVYAWGLFDQRIGINQIVSPGYTLSFAAKWYGKKGVLFESIHKSGGDAMIQRAHDLISEADAVCHYNGTKFDMPILRKEMVLRGMPPPEPYKQIDLLQTARRQFKFASNKLDYVAQALGLGSKVEHKGMDLWRDCMDGCPKAWRVMEKYNKQDVILLEKLYEKLLPWIQNHPNLGLYDPKDRPSCTNCGSTHLQSRGYARSKTQQYRKFQCQDCGTWVRARRNETPNRDNILVSA